MTAISARAVSIQSSPHFLAAEHGPDAVRVVDEQGRVGLTDLLFALQARDLVDVGAELVARGVGLTSVEARLDAVQLVGQAGLDRGGRPGQALHKGDLIAELRASARE